MPFQALPAVRLTVSAGAQLEPVEVQLPGAYIVVPSSGEPGSGTVNTSAEIDSAVDELEELADYDFALYYQTLKLI